MDLDTKNGWLDKRGLGVGALKYIFGAERNDLAQSFRIGTAGGGDHPISGDGAVTQSSGKHPPLT